jgi:hypothetical protein
LSRDRTRLSYNIVRLSSVILTCHAPASASHAASARAHVSHSCGSE